MGVNVGNIGSSAGTIASRGRRLDPDSDGFVPVSQQRALDKSVHQPHSNNSGIGTVNKFDTLEGQQQEVQWVS